MLDLALFKPEVAKGEEQGWTALVDVPCASDGLHTPFAMMVRHVKS